MADKTFYLNNGSTFSTLKAFSKTLQTLDEETFNFHVNEEKNDFANWIEFALKEEKLGQEVQLLTSKEKIELVVLRNLVHSVKKKPTKKTPKKVEIKTK